MDLTSYADLAVRLVNSAPAAAGDSDALRGTEEFLLLAADCGLAPGRVGQGDLTALRWLRTQLTEIFAAAACGAAADAAERLNALLIQHPVHPELVSHGEQGWHLHLAGTSSLGGRLATGAVFGLSMLVSQHGFGRLRVCAAAGCPQVYLEGGPAPSRRYCAGHEAARDNVTVLPPGRQPGPDTPAATAAS